MTDLLNILAIAIKPINSITASNDNYGIIIAIISAIGLVLAACVGGGMKIMEILYKNRIEKSKKKHYSLKDITMYALNIDKILFDILTKLNASRIILARFHNGGTFIGGLPIDKFSVTNEIYGDDVDHSITQMMQNILLSTHSQVIHELLVSDCYFRASLNDVPNGFKKMLSIGGVKSVYLFLIKDIDETPMSFICITFNEKETELHQDEISYVWKNHNFMLKLMTYYTENNKTKKKD